MKKNLKLLAVIPFVGFAIHAQANYDSNASTTEGTSIDTTTTERNTTDTVYNSGSITPTTGATSKTTTTTSQTAKTSSPSVMDQSSGTAQDVEVTRTIRESLSNSSALSTSAKNVEVVTLNNVITLRGAVASAAEKREVAKIAQGSAGTRSVNNEITVDTSKR